MYEKEDPRDGVDVGQEEEEGARWKNFHVLSPFQLGSLLLPLDAWKAALSRSQGHTALQNRWHNWLAFV